MCAQEVRSSLQKVDGISHVTLVMKPASAHFTFEPQKESIQDLIRAVRAAGSKYDARLMLQSNADDDKLTAALQAVNGVRSAGMQDSKGLRLVTFLMDKTTYYADLTKAASSIGATLTNPTFDKEKPGN